MDNLKTSCNLCIHRKVCKHSKDYADICTAAESMSNHLGKFECFGSIEVSCKFFKEDY